MGWMSQQKNREIVASEKNLADIISLYTEVRSCSNRGKVNLASKFQNNGSRGFGEQVADTLAHYHLSLSICFLRRLTTMLILNWLIAKYTYTYVYVYICVLG